MKLKCNVKTLYNKSLVVLVKSAVHYHALLVHTKRGTKLKRVLWLLKEQSRNLSLCSLLRRLVETSYSRKFRYKIDIDWFVRQYKWPEVKFQGVRQSFISKLGMRNSTRSPLFPDFKSDLSRAARFTTADQEEQRLWVRGYSGKIHRTVHFYLFCKHANSLLKLTAATIYKIQNSIFCLTTKFWTFSQDFCHFQKKL